MTETERHYIIELMDTDSQGLATHYNFRFVLQAVKDYKTYVQFGILFGYVDKRLLYTRGVFLTLPGLALLSPATSLHFSHQPSSMSSVSLLLMLNSSPSLLSSQAVYQSFFSGFFLTGIDFADRT